MGTVYVLYLARLVCGIGPASADPAAAAAVCGIGWGPRVALTWLGYVEGAGWHGLVEFWPPEVAGPRMDGRGRRPVTWVWSDPYLVSLGAQRWGPVGGGLRSLEGTLAGV